jgi:hypothetical protein
MSENDITATILEEIIYPQDKGKKKNSLEIKSMIVKMKISICGSKDKGEKNLSKV